MWAWAMLHVGVDSLRALATPQDKEEGMIREQTLPIFELAVKLFVFVFASYYLMAAWDIDGSAWLAAAGGAGIVFGFAAQQTLGDLFAGVFILTDTPYRLGDMLTLDGGLRGRVTRIGMRTTRIVTIDGVEVVVPNSRIAGSTVVNESGGPTRHERVTVAVDVAYASDLDQVRQVLEAAAAGLDVLVQNESRFRPLVRFAEFGASGISVQLKGWIRDPRAKEAAIDQMVVVVHRALRQADIEIPFPQVGLQWAVRPPEGQQGWGAVEPGEEGA